MNADTAVALGKLALAFGRVNRATFHEDGIRPETDTDHTVMLGVIAIAACPPELDVGRVAEFCLVHDLVEAKVGDTNSYDITPEARAAKDKREEEAHQDLIEEFVDTAPRLIQMITCYELQRLPEARYVRYLDKAMPKITHLLNGCAAIKALGDSAEDMQRVHEEQFAKLSKEYPEFDDTDTSRLMWRLMVRSVEAYANDCH